MPSQIIIDGTIKLAESSKPLPGLRIEIWDGTPSPSGGYGWLASAESDISGIFSVVINDPIASLIDDTTISIKYKVYKKNIFVREDSIADHTDPLDILIDTGSYDQLIADNPTPTGEVTYVTFWGFVDDSNKHPLQGAIINIYENGFRNKILIATTKADIAGNYKVNVNTKLINNTNVLANRSIRIEVVNSSSDLLAASEDIFQWVQRENIEVNFNTGSVNTEAKFDKLKSVIETVVGTTVPISELAVDLETSTDEIKYVAGATGYDNAVVQDMVHAHKFAEETTLPADIVYAFMKEGGDIGRNPLHYMKEAQLREAVTKAIEQNLIQNYTSTEINTQIAAARAYKVTQAKETEFEGEAYTMNDALLSIFSTQTETDDFLDMYHGDNASINDFWENYATTYGGPAASKAQLGLSLASVCCFQPKILERLMTEIGTDHISTLGKWDTDQWATMIADVCATNTELCVPVNIRGEETDPGNTSIQELYAEKMAQISKALFPVAHISAQFEAVDGNELIEDNDTRDSAIAFIQNNPDFDFISNDIHDIQEGGDFDLTDVSDLSALKAALAPFQIMNRIAGNNPVAVCALVRDGVNSASSIVNLGLERFIETYGDYFPEEEGGFSEPHSGAQPREMSKRAGSLVSRIFSTTATTAYIGALTTASLSTSMAVGSLVARGGVGTAPIDTLPGYDLGTTGLVAIPPYFRGGLSTSISDDASLAALFGNQDYCNCCDCMSLYSPAAYLADTLHFLEVKEPDTYNALKAKRPDLINIDLACKNGDTPIPYIDIVNELLELKILSAESTNIPGTLATFSFQTTGTAQELAAYPEHTYKDTAGNYKDYTAFSSGTPYNSVYNDTNLGGAVYPSSLPFNLAIEETRAYLSHFGISRYEMMKLFMPYNNAISGSTVPTNSITDFSLYSEWFGMSVETAKIVVGLHSLSASNYRYFYGTVSATTTESFPSPTAPGSVITGTWNEVICSRIDLFLQQTGITYSELLQCLATNYINPNNTTTPDITITTVSPSTPIDTCKLDELKLSFVNPVARTNFLKKFYRFVRLYKTNKLNIYQWDMLLRSMYITDIDLAAFIQIGRALTLAERMKISPVIFSCLWNVMDTKEYMDYPNGRTDKLPTLYSSIFNNKGIVNVNGTNELADPTALPAHYRDATEDHFQQIANCCSVEASDVSFILEFAIGIIPNDPVSINGLSRTYVYCAMMKAWKLKAAELRFLLFTCFYQTTPYGRMNPVGPASNLTEVETYLTNIEKFIDFVEAAKRSKFNFTELMYLNSWTTEIRAKNSTIKAFYENLRTELKKNYKEALTSTEEVNAQNNKLANIIYQRFAKQFNLHSQVVMDLFANVSPVNYMIKNLTSANFINSTYTLLWENLDVLDAIQLFPGVPIVGMGLDPSNSGNVAPFVYIKSIYDWFHYFQKAALVTKKLLLRPREFEYLFFNPSATGFDFRLLLKAESIGGTSYIGSLITTTLHSGGSGYSAGQSFSIDGWSGSTGTGKVLTTTPGGTVLTYMIENKGSGYSVNTGVTTTATGASGLKINITEIFNPIYTSEDIFTTVSRLLCLSKTMELANRLHINEDGLEGFLYSLRGVDTSNAYVPLLPPSPVITDVLYVEPTPVLTTDPSYGTKISACYSKFQSYFQIMQQHDHRLAELIGNSIHTSGYVQVNGVNAIMNMKFSSNPSVSDFGANSLEHLRTLIRIVDILYWTERFKLNVLAVHNLLIEDVTVSDTRKLIMAMKGTYDMAGWARVAKPLRDTIRVKQRDALMAYTRTRPNTIFANLLIDVEMDACMMTSRIKQAINSVQLFIDRVVLGLELKVGSTTEKLILQRATVREWQSWRKWYGTWHANRQVFFFPENWMEPELRDDKSQFFKELETQLRQDEVTAGKVEDAVKVYLQKLEEVARLEPVGTCDEYTNDGQLITHVISRTYGGDKKYYHRILKNNIWYAWEKIDIDIKSDHVLPYVWNNKLYIFWLTFIEKSAIFTEKMSKNDETTGPDAYGQAVKNNKWFYNEPLESALNENTNAKKYKQLEVIVNWSEYKDGQWKNQKIGKETMLLKINPWIEYDFNHKIPTYNSVEGPIFRHLSDNYQKSIMDFIKSRISIYPYAYDPAAYDDVLVYAPGTGGAYEPKAKSSLLTAGDLYLMVMFPTFGEGGSHVHDEYASFIKSFHFQPGMGLTGVTRDFMFNTVTVPSPNTFFRNMKHTYHTFPPATPNYSLQQYAYSSLAADYIYNYDKDIKSDILAVYTSGAANVLNKGISDYNIYPKSDYYNPVGEKYMYEDKTNTFFARYQVVTKHAYSIYRDIDSTMRFVGTLYELPGPIASGYIALPIDIETRKCFFQTFYHPHVRDFVRTINYYGLDGFMRPDKVATELGRPAPVVQTFADTMDFATKYDPTSLVWADEGYTYPTNTVEFGYRAAYACYNWELFFHIPMLVAQRLSDNQQFAEAQKWYHYIFDPTSTTYMASGGSGSQKFWKFKLFYDLAGTTIESLDDLLDKIRQEKSDALDQVEASNMNPFNTYAVGRARPIAFMKWVFMKYIDNLIVWGDRLFTRNTIESINEATQIYILASNLLGKKPEEIPQRSIVVPSKSYREIASAIDLIGEASIALESRIASRLFRVTDLSLYETHTEAATAVAAVSGAGSGSGTGTGAGTYRADTAIRSSGYSYAGGTAASGGAAASDASYVDIGYAMDDSGMDPALARAFLPAGTTGTVPTVPHVNYFCVKPNMKLSEYCDIVADRLYKIRHCKNIRGNTQQLPLFEPPINPALLVQAAALGLDINSVLDDISGANTPNYRFTFMLQKANEFCNDVKALGNALLSAMEKKDAEELSLLRQGQERNMLQAVLQMKKKQVDEAKENLEGLIRTRNNIQARFDYYNSREYMNAREKEHLKSMKEALSLQTAQGIIQGVTAVLHVIPEINLQAPFSVGPTFGGRNLGSMMETTSSILGIRASILSAVGAMASVSGGYDRRMDDWKFQAQSADLELLQVEKQIAAADIRVQVAQNDLENQQLQIENSIAVDTYLKSKFTKVDLYDKMSAKIAETYFMAYQMAVTMAKKAEACYTNELRTSGKMTGSFIKPGYWDSLKKGLLAGDNLQYDLRVMEASYYDDNKRTLELTKHVSLAMFDPNALLALKTEGDCTIHIPEELYDLDFPTHYNRTIKSISMSIPCVAGPYTTIPCTLSHNGSRIRISPTATDSTAFRPINNIPCHTIATSGAQNDSGMFEFNFRDERYLPFEGAGAECQLYLKLGGLSTAGESLKPFDFSTIGDVILHIKYTALDGAADRSAHVWDKLQEGVYRDDDIIGLPEIKLQRIFSLKHEFPNEWASYASTSSGTPTLNIPFKPEQFPFFTDRREITISSLAVSTRRSSGYDDLTTDFTPPIVATFKKGTTTLHDFILGATEPVIFSITPSLDPVTDTLSINFEDAVPVAVNMDPYLDDIFLIVEYSLT